MGKESVNLKLVGIKIFIVIGALLNKDYNFIYDLKLFFWVLFWICLYYNNFDKKGKIKRRIISQYMDWIFLLIGRLAYQKTGQISKRIFDNVDKNFTEHYKPLIPYMRELHRVVFPKGSPWSMEHRELYSDMKRILEKARNRIDVKVV